MMRRQEYEPNPAAVPLGGLDAMLDRLLALVWHGARWRHARKPGKFAFMTRFLPPLWSGQAVVIGRLLAGVEPTQYCLITRPLDGDRGSYQESLPARYHDLPPERRLRATGRWQGWIDRFNLVSAIVQRGWRAARVLKQEGVTSLIVCTGDLIDPPAGWLASRLAGCDLYLYSFDDFTLQWWADPTMVRRAGRAERLICRSAAGLIAPNEVMAEVLRRRYGRACWVVRNPTRYDPAPPAAAPFPASGDEIRVVFTGAVYHLNIDILLAVKEALRRHNEARGSGAGYRLHIYTAQSQQSLSAQGLYGEEVVLHNHVPPAEIEQVQRVADILLIPFSRVPAASDFVKSSATAKLADYLATGRPILALCPKNSFVGGYLEGNRCGMVVDSDSPAVIAEAVERIAEDGDLRRCLAEAAVACARRDFDPAKAQAGLMALLRGAA